ncbi:hypothetical protein RWE15_03825 [Virgibacillus halophilus]|uniref:Uncharacterized protein n=1 Tax=Tigheibacillus halophilus TaxID=361280 RepID=A0ABU5C5B1_9BACI|nr:hypothetical protein [Virgibacillus halophilus]
MNKKKLINQIEHDVVENYQAENQLVKQLAELLNNKLDVSMSTMDELLLTFYLGSQSIAWNNDNFPRAIIVAHGYATASSIANVANRMLHKNIFEAFDMPLDTSIEDIAKKRKSVY